MSETNERTDWIKRMLGMPIPLEGMGPLRVGPPPPTIDRPRRGLERNRNVRGERIKNVAPPLVRKYGDQEITSTQFGGITYKAPRPPVSEINFAGGGGKGTALLGAVQALQDGTLANCKKINGASVGAITTALLAAGIKLDELATVVDSQDTVSLITDGTMGGKMALLKTAMSNKGSPLTGDGVKEVVAGAVTGSLQMRCVEMRENGDDVSQVERLLGEIDPKLGPTFKQMKQLADLGVPGVKEMSITGTYREELELSKLSGAGVEKLSDKDKSRTGKLFIFSADNTPDMPVSLAVQASAAFPVAFKPVDIDLSKYMGKQKGEGDYEVWKVRFVDGGVMNNTPTKASIGDEMPLDPLPTGSEMNFVFEGSDSANVITKKNFKITSSAGMGDKVTKSNNWAAEYGLFLDAQEHANDFVVVPLKFKYTDLKGKKRAVDMSGTAGGTLNFTPKPQDVAQIRKRTKESTEQNIQQRKEPLATQFATEQQMLLAIGMNELQQMIVAKPPFPRAQEAKDLRLAVAQGVDQFKLGDRSSDSAERKKKTEAFLKALDELAKGDPDRLGYIAREIHKAKLDDVIDHVGDKGMSPTGLGDAVGLVSEAKKVFAISQRLLKEMIYPKMGVEKEGGASFTLLETAAKALRKAVSWMDLHKQLFVMFGHYNNKRDTRSRRGHAQFAKDIDAEIENMMRVSKK